jgi:hypothetical protein
MYFDAYWENPPDPYVIERLGHSTYIAPPNLNVLFAAMIKKYGTESDLVAAIGRYGSMLETMTNGKYKHQHKIAGMEN